MTSIALFLLTVLCDPGIHFSEASNQYSHLSHHTPFVLPLHLKSLPGVTVLASTRSSAKRSKSLRAKTPNFELHDLSWLPMAIPKDLDEEAYLYDFVLEDIEDVSFNFNVDTFPGSMKYVERPMGSRAKHLRL